MCFVSRCFFFFALPHITTHSFTKSTWPRPLPLVQCSRASTCLKCSLTSCSHTGGSWHWTRPRPPHHPIVISLLQCLSELCCGLQGGGIPRRRALRHRLLQVEADEAQRRALFHRAGQLNRVAVDGEHAGAHTKLLLTKKSTRPSFRRSTMLSPSASVNSTSSERAGSPRAPKSGRPGSSGSSAGRPFQ